MGHQDLTRRHSGTFWNILELQGATNLMSVRPGRTYWDNLGHLYLCVGHHETSWDLMGHKVRRFIIKSPLRYIIGSNPGYSRVSPTYTQGNLFAVTGTTTIVSHLSSSSQYETVKNTCFSTVPPSVGQCQTCTNGPTVSFPIESVGF